MQIIRAEVQNFKRIELVQITPSGEVIEVTGRNGQGKSSILDAIEAALGGKEHDPKRPIRRGQEKARVVLDLGDLIVERTWTEKTDRLVLKNRDGASYPRPQERLNDLVGGLAFDPLAFMTMKPVDQRATLLRVIGVDLDAFAARRKATFDHRTGVNRDLKTARARLEAVAEPPEGTPDTEISVAELSDRLQEAMKQGQKNREVRQAAADRADDVDDARSAVREQEQEIRRLEELLARAREGLTGLQARLQEAEEAEQTARAAAAALVDPDLEDIQRQIREADATNKLVRQKASRRELAAEVDRLAAAADADTRALAQVDQEQEKVLTAAAMPVEGLAIAEDGVTFNGLPLEQASTMEQIRVCTAIGAALNPELRIALIRHGNDLDPQALEAFYAECQAHGLQAWVERISGIGENAIVIEEGLVAGAAPVEEAQPETPAEGQQSLL